MAKTCERGSGSVLTLSICLLVGLAALLGVWVSSWFGCIAKAQNLADQAAIAAAVNFNENTQPDRACERAQAVAKQAGEQLTECEIEGGQYSFVVRAKVRVKLTPKIGAQQFWVMEGSKAGR